MNKKNKWQEYKINILNAKENYIFNQNWNLIEEYAAILSFFIRDMIENIIKNLWNEIVIHLPQGQYFHVQLRIKIVDINGNEYIKSLSYLQTISSQFSLEKLSNKLLEFWDLKFNNYELDLITEIILKYKLTNEIKETKINNHKNLTYMKIKPYKIGKFNLPNTIDFTLWGETLFIDDFTKAIVVKPNSKSKYYISIYDRYIYVELKIDNEIVLSFEDHMTDNTDLNSFKRIIKNNEYIFDNGIMILKKNIKKTKFIKPLKLHENISTKIMTMDLETKVINNIMNVYSCSIYDGINTLSYYFNSTENILKNALLFIFTRKYDGYRIYFHNFAQFDIVFLINILIELCDEVKPIKNNGKYIEIKVKYKNYRYYFRDSYLMLKLSLDDLSKYSLGLRKGLFPYDFVNIVDLNYIGELPSKEYFNNITDQEYDNYSKEFINKLWSLKNETIKYCNLDVKLLIHI